MNIIKYFKKHILGKNKDGKEIVEHVAIDSDGATIEIKEGEHYLDLNNNEHVFINK